jgi:hypothetical protein
MEQFNKLIDEAVDLLHIENRSFEYIVESFDSVVTFVFEDGAYNWGRFIVLEFYAKALVNRTVNIDRDLLLAALNQRIERSKCLSGFH